MKNKIKVATIIKLGALLATIGALTYLSLFLTHEILVNYPLIYLLFLLVILGGYVGMGILIAGIFLWSLTLSKNVKVAVLILLATITFFIVTPIPQECRFDYDFSICSVVYPYEFKYWYYMFIPNEFQTINESFEEVIIRDNPFLRIILGEGVGDVWEEVVNTAEKLK